MEIGSHVIYVDEFGKRHHALVTQKWGPPHDASKGVPAPSLNLVHVDGDTAKSDQYGRQISRPTSVVHKSNQNAHGRYWIEP